MLLTTEHKLQLWSAHKEEHNLRLESSEVESRLFDIFSERSHMIHEHNRKDSVTYSLTHNKFSTWSQQELSSILTLKTDEKDYAGYRGKPKFQLSASKDDTPVPFYDARDFGWMPPVKNQERCGSCYAMAAVELAQFVNIKNKNIGACTQLSVQQVVDDASLEFSCNGCDGGTIIGATEYIRSKGIVLEKDYPYEGHRNKEGKDVRELKKYKMNQLLLPSDDPTKDDYNEAMVKFLYSVGVVAVAIKVELEKDGKDLFHYSSGIYPAHKIYKNDPNHAVTLIGYKLKFGMFGPYYIAKNSWGNNWGCGGYFKIAMPEGPEDASLLARYAVGAM